MGPDWVRNFLEGEDEGAGFADYPATKGQILAAWRSRMQDILSDGETTLSDPQWLDTHLPERSYQDPGEVFLALCPVLSGPALDATHWFARATVTALANGTRLQVPPGQVALLSDPSGRVLDAFPSGEHVLSPATAPQAAAASRPPAPGVSRFSIRATPLFCYAGDLEVQVQHASRPPPMPPAAFSATVRFFLKDPGRFARSPAARELQNSSPSTQRLLMNLLQASFEGLDASSVSDHAKVEALVRSTLENAGLGLRSMNFVAGGPYGMPPSFVGGGAPGGMPGIPPEVLARMPPGARAMMEAKMKEAMEARAAGTGSGVRAGPPGQTAARPMPPGAFPPNLVACPSCHAPNPAAMNVCRACGKPLRAGA